ncbi:transmembrane protein 165-like [Anneissia japonica]|uniref:transmembrane protein 165-like n=1 Tax=Anneissia japonica TaxID=1529436 RepID=UPI0014257E71|nr:transmembrane protein 165-like [Anneissia japonica]XP_033097377.1 transmembrane protein 165-like [Anneissia japonica]
MKNLHFCLLALIGILHVAYLQAELVPQEPAEPQKVENGGDNIEFQDEDRKDETKKTSITASGLGFVHGFLASLSVIIVSELGDKTFFIAAIMAMRHPRLTIFTGALLALAIMTILSAFLGFATTVIPRAFTYYASTALFAIFGLKMLRDGFKMSHDEGQEEFEEVQADLKRRDEEREKESMAGVTEDPESGIIRVQGPPKFLGIFSPIFLQALTLTFLAEWGDRSQITTIILAARENVFGVTIGGILGHAICTALAVIGGRMIAQRISVKTVTLIGGVVFLVFALSALFFNPDD